MVFKPTLGVHNLSLWFYCARLCYLTTIKKVEVWDEKFIIGDNIHNWFIQHPNIDLPFNVELEFNGYLIKGLPDGVIKTKHGLQPIEFKSYPTNKNWVYVNQFQIQLYTYMFIKNNLTTNPIGYLVNLTNVGLTTQKIILPFNFEKILDEILTNLTWVNLPPCKPNKCKNCLIKSICEKYFSKNKKGGMKNVVLHHF